MSYKEELQVTNLAADDIRDTIGCPSNNLAHYCCKAATGGSGGYAFNILENGSTPSNGTLIDGALPYFNIFAENTPAEWYADNGVGLLAGFPASYKCRLRRNIYGDVTINGNLFDENSYCFDLGAFAGYKHAVGSPPMVSVKFLGYSGSNITALVKCLPGSGYDFDAIKPAGSQLGVYFSGDYTGGGVFPDYNNISLDLGIHTGTINMNVAIGHVIAVTGGEMIPMVAMPFSFLDIQYDLPLDPSEINYFQSFRVNKPDGSGLVMGYNYQGKANAVGNSGICEYEIKVTYTSIFPYPDMSGTLYAMKTRGENQETVSCGAVSMVRNMTITYQDECQFSSAFEEGDDVNFYVEL